MRRCVGRTWETEVRSPHVVARLTLGSTIRIVLGEFHRQSAYDRNEDRAGLCLAFHSYHLDQLLAALSHIAQFVDDQGLEQEDKPPAEDVDIRDFPQTDAVWQADFVRSPAWVMNECEGAYRPWSVLVPEKSPCCALLTTHTPGDPTPDMLLEFLVRAMAGTRGYLNFRRFRVKFTGLRMPSRM